MAVVLLFFGVTLGFFLLIKGADFLVEGSVATAVRLKVPQVVIGLTIVAFGTSAPELIVNIVASFQSKSDLIIGNIVGSNIFNILFILGACGIIKTINLDKRATLREMPFSILAVIILYLLANVAILGQGNMISRGEGIIFLVFFLIFLAYIFFVIKNLPVEDISNAKKMGVAKSVFYITLGLFGLFIGGRLVVDNAVEIAKMFGISEKFIALTIVSAGTSLPELFTSAVAALKGRSAIAAGNIIGSNIFNIFLILGVSAVIRPVSFDMEFNTDIITLFVASVFLFLSMFIGTKYSLGKWKSGALLGMFLLYMIFLFIRG